MGTDKAVLIVNAGSRTGHDVLELTRQRLEELGLPIAEAHPVDDPPTLPQVLGDVLAGGATMIVLAGGDGTISTAANRLCGTDVVLGVLPTGTANDFARTLQVPTDLPAACEAIVNGKVSQVDLGTLGNDERFLNVASVGLSVGVTRALTPKLKRYLGVLAYPIAAIKAYQAHTPFSARLEFPDGDHEPIDLDDLLQVAVANGRFYGGGAVVAPDAGINDHVLDVYAIPRGTALHRFYVLRHFVSGAFTEQDNVLHVKTRAIRLVTTPELPINVDGEVGPRTPQLFGIVPSSLNVMIPQEADPSIWTTHASHDHQSGS